MKKRITHFSNNLDKNLKKVGEFKHRIYVLVLVCLLLWSYVAITTILHKKSIGDQISDIASEIILRYQSARLAVQGPDRELPIPVEGVMLKDLANNWGDPRSGGRSHEGIDIFAERGTPVFSATDGYVVGTGVGDLGGLYVFTIGKGGRQYYYAHLNAFEAGIKRGKAVTTDTVLGYIGTTGNARNTPPHLHFGVYTVLGAINPYTMFVERAEESG